MRVSFLNVGQGDAIFIESPTHRQILIDGGKDGAVLRELGAVMPWWDRSIYVVVATHPDLDHIGGLIEVLKRYRVRNIFQSDVLGDTPQVRTLAEVIANESKHGAQLFSARRGQRIDIGGGAYIEILFPDRGVDRVETNTGSVILRVVYGDTSFLLTGDSPSAVEEFLVALDGKKLKSDVLKAGHHGSRTSSSLLFVGFVDPEYAVFSRSCDNTYGHPHREVRETFSRFNIAVKDTCVDGRITFETDGTTVVAK